MDRTRSSLSNIIPRSMLGLNNLIILSSSAIITGILSWFLHRYRYRGTHLVYNEVIAVLTLFFYLGAMVAPAFKSYRGYLLPLNLALSYLWLTSLIFSSQHWAGHRCEHSAPSGYVNSTGTPSVPGHHGHPGTTTYTHHCKLKHAVEAFNIIGFSFVLFNTIIEAIMWATHHKESREMNGNGYNKAACTTSVPGTAVPSNGTGQHAVV